MQQFSRGASASKFILTAALAWTCAAGTANALPISGQGTWESTLQARDINSDGVTDAFYDTSLNITWLADSNYAKTLGLDDLARSDKQGRLSYDSGQWVSTIDIHGVTGWRMAGSQTQNDPSCAGKIKPGFGCSFQADPNLSELGHLYYETLGNSYGPGGLTNTGLFTNLEPSNAGYTYHMTSYNGTYGTGMQTFAFDLGATNINKEQYFFLYWAVRDGDVPAVVSHAPEPETWAMMLMGLAGVGAWARRQKKRG
jgi:hypothetical protein